MLAEANAIGNSEITAGTTLKVPDVGQHKNDAVTFKPYNPADTIGDTSPSLPYIPAPEGPACWKIIVVIVVVIVVTWATQGALTDKVAPLAAAFLGGVAGSVAGQVVGKALGVVDHFSLREAVASGITNMLTLGIEQYANLGVIGKIMESSKFARAAMTAVMNSVTGYIGNKIAGVPDTHFSWKAIAASAVASALTTAAFGDAPSLAAQKGTSVVSDTSFWSKVGTQFARAMVSRITQSAAEVALTGKSVGDNDPGLVLANAFGTAIGNAIVGTGEAYKAKKSTERWINYKADEALEKVDSYSKNDFTVSMAYTPPRSARSAPDGSGARAGAMGPNIMDILNAGEQPASKPNPVVTAQEEPKELERVQVTGKRPKPYVYSPAYYNFQPGEVPRNMRMTNAQAASRAAYSRTLNTVAGRMIDGRSLAPYSPKVIADTKEIIFGVKAPTPFVPPDAFTQHTETIAGAIVGAPVFLGKTAVGLAMLPGEALYMNYGEFMYQASGGEYGKGGHQMMAEVQYSLGKLAEHPIDTPMNFLGEWKDGMLALRAEGHYFRYGMGASEASGNVVLFADGALGIYNFGARSFAKAGAAADRSFYTAIDGELSYMDAAPRYSNVISSSSNVEPSIFSSFSGNTTLQFSSLAEQAEFLSSYVPGLSQSHASAILEAGFSRDSSLVFGGSRVRGDFSKTSDLDLGFGNLTERQAARVIKFINEQGYDIKLEKLTIVPGKETPTIQKIITPEEFFQRSGVRAGGDLRAGEPYIPSGSITVTKDGQIVIVAPRRL